MASSLALLAGAPLCLAACAAPVGPGPSAGPGPRGAPTASAASAPAQGPAVSQAPPTAPDGWPLASQGFSGVVGVYWPSSDDAEVQADGVVALSLDEAGRAWLFLRIDRDWLGFVVAASGGAEGWGLEAAAGVELPAALRGARFRVRGDRLVEERAGSTPRTRTRDEAKALGLLAPGTTLEGAAPARLVAHGPLLVGHAMGRAADECWVGLALPHPPAARGREGTAPGRLPGVWIGDSLEPEPGAPCGLAARASARPIEVEGAISDLVMMADARGPLALVAVGYMAAIVFVPEGRKGDPALARALEEGLRAAE